MPPNPTCGFAVIIQVFFEADWFTNSPNDRGSVSFFRTTFFIPNVVVFQNPAGFAMTGFNQNCGLQRWPLPRWWIMGFSLQCIKRCLPSLIWRSLPWKLVAPMRISTSVGRIKNHSSVGSVDRSEHIWAGAWTFGENSVTALSASTLQLQFLGQTIEQIWYRLIYSMLPPKEHVAMSDADTWL